MACLNQSRSKRRRTDTRQFTQSKQLQATPATAKLAPSSAGGESSQPTCNNTSCCACDQVVQQDGRLPYDTAALNRKARGTKQIAAAHKVMTQHNGRHTASCQATATQRWPVGGMRLGTRTTPHSYTHSSQAGVKSHSDAARPPLPPQARAPAPTSIYQVAAHMPLGKHLRQCKNAHMQHATGNTQRTSHCHCFARKPALGSKPGAATPLIRLHKPSSLTLLLYGIATPSQDELSDSIALSSPASR
jgi:hypothetical protein